MNAEEMMTKFGAANLPDDERHVCKVIVDAYAEVTDEETYLEVRRDILQPYNELGILI
ncbi:hypothetical protein HYZ99_05565 [Candidatus Peregrinibacteria bacterium]|nr:hypothetical protein [Candidatus Peregrinibacteria bacterium]